MGHLARERLSFDNDISNNNEINVQGRLTSLAKMYFEAAVERHENLGNLWFLWGRNVLSEEYL